MISIGSYEIKRNHLLVIGILVLAFSISFLIRMQPMDYGYELNEFDPFFNYRATQYLVENGLDEYYNWHDSLSWHPGGRNVTYDSQIILHITTAATYWIFGGNSSLYDFTIIFPVIIGSLTVIVVFALVRTIAGTTAGLFSALLFAISMPILLRGLVGWYKSEPLGLFYGILAIYLFLSGLKSKNKKIASIKLISAGIILVLGISAWGGLQFFFIPLMVFIISLPFFRTDHKFLLWSIPLFTISILLTSLIFERLSVSFVGGIEGFVIVAANIIMAILIFISQKNEKNKQRNGIAFIIAIIILAAIFFVINADSEILGLPNHRYLNAINPFLTTTDPLVDSVSEHSTTSLNDSFYFHSSLMILSAIGIWRLLTRHNKNFILKKDMIAFSLIFGIMGVYSASTFVRLELFASLSIIILSSISLAILSNRFLNTSSSSIKFNSIFKPVFIAGIIILLVLPLTIPSNNWVSGLSIPPTILNGGALFDIATNDWPHAMQWLANNTPEDAVVAAWWDYGYWIQTLGHRTTLVDNATLSTDTIIKVANMLVSTPDESWNQLNELDADYLLIFVAAERVESQLEFPVYFLDGGGDESKKHWIMRISGQPLGNLVHQNGITGTEYFWKETTFGQTIPFSPFAYVNIEHNVTSPIYQPGLVPVFTKDVKFTQNENEPLKLVYTSPSFNEDKIGPIIGVFIYEVNKNYVPKS